MKNQIQIFLLIFISGINLLKGFSQEKSNTWDFNFPKKTENQVLALDLRYLNEKFAGEHGFIKLSNDSSSFVRGDGEPIRFWPVNIAASSISDSVLRIQARFLAQMGVNMFRYHAAINPKGKGTSLYDFDINEIKNIWRYVSIMKKEGIYTTISPFWPHNGHMGGWIPVEWSIEGYSGKDDLWGAFYFSDTLRMGYKNWIRALYTLTNPYTGIALKDDPAIALIQIINEDGVFFWTMQNLKPELKNLVINKFVLWLETQYGSLANAYSAWGDAKLPDDNITDKKLGLYSTWDMTQLQTGNKAIRLRDQVRFYAETQYNVYKEIHDFYRNDLGSKQLINAGNWTTASPSRLLDLERWTNTSCDVMAANRYFDPGHFGENNGWRIDPGHYYIGESALLNPTRLPINVKQVFGHPFLITESGWNTPQKYMTEGPFLISTYQSLTGIDGFYWFCITHENYEDSPYFEFTKYPDGQCAMNRWTCSLPGILAQFPANALVFRAGYLKQAAPVIIENKSTQSLMNRYESPIYEDRNFDPNRDQLFTGGQANSNATISPLAFLTGAIVINYSGNEIKTQTNKQLKNLIDTQGKTIKSITGEQELDYGNGICAVNSEYAKGICGFVNKKKEFDLDGVKIKTQNEYAAIWVVSLDGKPLKISEKILIQCGTVYKPTNWEEQKCDFTWDNKNYKGFKIVNTGKMPWQADNTVVTIEIDNTVLTKASLLNTAGYKNTSVNMNKTKNKLSVQLPLNSLYLVLEK